MKTMRPHILRGGILLLALSTLLNAARAQTAPTAPAPVSPWTGKDAQGHALKLPEEGKVTLLVFLRPGQDQSQEVMKIVTPMTTRADLQVVAVVSGDDASTLAGALEQAKWNAPVAIDTTYSLCGALNVNVWPTTVVLGKQAATAGVDAHLAGLPATYANDLSAYVDFATGKIDKAARDEALANREPVTDSTEQRAARHVEVALRLASREMTEDARAELERALALKPAEAPTLVSIARVDLILHTPKPALEILDKLKDGKGVTANELNVLRGWVAVEMEQWDQARALLTDAVRLNPDPAEALYLLGRVSAHDGKSAEAAEYFRKAFEKSDAGRQMGMSGAGDAGK
jgi:tetratricopeptide (TPR) repeat protein